MSPDSQSASRQLTKKAQQQRRHPRYSYDSPAMICRPLGPARAGWIQNLSEGGVMVELSEPFPPGTPLDVFISLTGKSIRAEAKVIWSQNSALSVEPRLGRAFCFLLQEASQYSINDILLCQMGANCPVLHV
jgi:hypothetical protein